MTFGKIKIRPADKYYSQWLRGERKCCERCGERKNLQCSHFYGRKAESVRFDPENTDCLCFFCHNYFEMNPADYADWKKSRMTPQAYKLLKVRAHTFKKRDDTLVLIWLNKIMGKPEKQKPRKQCSLHQSRICRQKPCMKELGLSEKKKKEKKSSGIQV